MPRKQQGWITFQSSTAERRILEQYCQQVQRSKTEVLREFLRTLGQIIDFYHKKELSLFLRVRDLVRLKLESKSLKVSAEVIIEISPGVEVTSIITMDSVESLGLKKGQEAYVIIKSSDVMIAVA